MMRPEQDWTAVSLAQAAQAIALGELSPLSLVQAHLERIERLDGQLNSFITLLADSALERARNLEQALKAGAKPGPLYGIPLAVKDLYETRGVCTTSGSKFFADYIPEADAAVVQKLEQAGAIMLGKLNMHEIALGVTNVNPHYGDARNPWDVQRVSGGSSGGSAVALAARLCMGSLGSDTGGSIRIPSSLCGVVGLKPTHGRVSLRGVMPLSWNLDHAGPMARHVEDVAILLQVIAGYDPEDPYSVNVPVDDYLLHLRDGIRGWRVALAEDEFFNRVDAEVAHLVRQAAQVFADLGAQIVPAALPGAHAAAQANGMMTISDAAALHAERMSERPHDFGVDVLTRLNMGKDLTLKDYIQCRRTQTIARRQFERFFENYDILLTPTTPVAAPLLQGPDAVEQARVLTRFTSLFNLTGLPALSLPCGFTAAGLPVGLQLITSPWAEARLLQAAHAYEQAAGWYCRTPDSSK